MVNITIEGQHYEVEKGLTILEAAKKCGYEIPSLCSYNHGECSLASCRVCLVEAQEGKAPAKLVASCVYPVSEGMVITIGSPKATAARRTSVELLLSNHSKNCQECDKNGKCELLHVAQIVGARDNMYTGSMTPVTVDRLTPSIKRDTSKCVLCGRCIARCGKAHGLSVLGFEKRGFNTIVAPAENRSFKDSPCILCGQCTTVCPTGALMEVNDIDKVDTAFKLGKHVIVQVAPAVRASLGEEFGNKIGTPVTGKMIAALRRLGFEKCYDVNFGADLTVMEESKELAERLEKVLEHLCGSVSNIFASECDIPDQLAPPAEVQEAESGAFVHGQGETVTSYAFLVTKGRPDGFSQGDAYVFHGVMFVHLKVSFAEDGKRHP